MEVYTIYVDGAERHTDVSEDEFMDLMEEFAYMYYQTGTPHPDSVKHIIRDSNG